MSYFEPAERMKQSVQITTDGFKVYMEAIESAFYEDVDDAVLQKVYGATTSRTISCGFTERCG